MRNAPRTQRHRYHRVRIASISDADRGCSAWRRLHLFPEPETGPAFRHPSLWESRPDFFFIHVCVTVSTHRWRDFDSGVGPTTVITERDSDPAKVSGCPVRCATVAKGGKNGAPAGPACVTPPGETVLCYR